MTRQTAEGDFDLDRTFSATYFSLRWLVVVIAAAFPLVLWWGGLFFRKVPIPLQESLSAYYATDMRDWFVGGLFAAAACLYVYKGLSDKEDRLLNLAALFAVGTAVNPFNWHPSWWFLPEKITPHGIFAVSFFAMIALACWLCQDDSLRLGVISPQDQTKYRAKYAATGGALVVLPAAAVVFNVLSGEPFAKSVFWAETLAIWVFGFYWYTKSGELKQAIEHAEKHRRLR